MTSDARARLAEVRNGLIEELSRDPQPSAQRLIEIDAQVRAINNLAEVLAPAAPAWRTPVTLAFFALSAVLLASAVRLPTVDVGLNAQATAFAVTIGTGDAMTAQSAESLKVRALTVAGSARPDVAVLQAVRFASGSRLEVIREREGCLRVRVLQGHLIAEALSAAPIGGVPDVREVSLPAGQSLGFCLAPGESLRMRLPVVALDVARTLDPGPPVVQVPSIEQGSLSIGVIGETRSLGPQDRLQFHKVADGLLLFAFKKNLNLNFAGEASEARAITLHTKEVRDLRPTLLQFLMESPEWRAFLAALTGALGLIGAGWRRLSSWWPR